MKNIQQKFLYMIGIVWIVILLNFMLKQDAIATVNDKSELEQVEWMLEKQEVTDICYHVSLVAKAEPREKQEQKEVLLYIANLLEEENIDIEQEIRSNGTSMYWKVEHSNQFLEVQYLDMEEDYMILTMEQTKNDENKDAVIYMNAFQQIVEEFHLTGIPCMSLTAHFPSVLSFQEKNMVSENIFYLFQAKEVDCIRGSDLYTVYGYSEHIPFGIYVAEQCINLNLSFSDLEESEQTKIEIGIPVSN